MTQFKTFSKLNRKSRSALVKVLDVSLEAAVRLLESAELKAARTWDHVRAKLLRGRPAEAITHSANRERADLLVMGSRGMTEFQPMLLGTVSRRVLLQACCPVLLVKKPARALKKIVLGTDGSVESWKAVAWLEQLPETIRPTVTVASVIPPLPLEGVRVPAGAVAVGDQVEGMLRREVQQLVSRVAGTLRKAGFSVKEMVMAGHPGARLVELARRERTDLMVVGSRSRRRAREYFMGSIADTVVKHAPCSVLVHRG
jgi:nucleotide-binding universal stress UspA family protein